MIREYRFKLSGLTFFILVFCIIFSTKNGFDLVIPSQESGMNAAILALIAAGASYASSEAFGYIFNAVFFISWSQVVPFLQGSRERAYSADYERYFKSGQIRQMMCGQWRESGSSDHPPVKLSGYSLDPCFSYFFQSDAPETLRHWVERRWTAFAVGMIEVVAIIASWLIALTVILETDMTMTFNTALIFVFSVLFGAICWKNAQLSRKEAYELMDLWQYAHFDQDARVIFRDFECRSRAHCRQEDKDNASPPG
jgi:hypothetical protein